MPTHSAKSTSDYFRLAQEKGLKFLGGIAPTNTNSTATWVCKRCGRQMTKSYRFLRDQTNGCRCRATAQQDAEMYQSLATKLFITWAYDPKTDYFPMNTKTPTKWANADGFIIEAPYHELAYRSSRNARHFTQLGIPIPEGNVLV